MTEAVNLTPDLLRSRISALPNDRQLVLKRMAGARFAPLIIERDLGNRAIDPGSLLFGGLRQMSQDPLVPISSEDLARIEWEVREWLDQFDEEPEDHMYWPYQGAVVIEYAATSMLADLPVDMLIRMFGYCIDFAYFVDEELDDGTRTAETAERAFWSEALDRLSDGQQLVGRDLLLMIQQDSRRLTELADELDRRAAQARLEFREGTPS